MCDCSGVEDGEATGALPLAMALPPELQQRQQQMVGVDVNVGDLTLSSGMKPSLQRLCDASQDPAEKAKALELLTALELSSAIKAAEDDRGGRPRRRAVTPATPASSRDHQGDDAGARRPRTAAPRLQAAARCGGVGGSGLTSYVNSYETTNNYYYQPPVPSPSAAVRPASSQLQRVVPPPSQLAPGNSFSDLFMSTTYGREFFVKPQDDASAAVPRAAAAAAATAATPERAGSARGVRNNNPHPSREFLVWRYRRPMTATAKIEEAAAAAASSQSTDDCQALQMWEGQQEKRQHHPKLTNDAFDRAVRGKCRSTYQHDYLGVPTSFDVGQRAVSLLALEEKRRRPAFDRGSTSRDAFGPPAPMPPELAVSGVRFGGQPRAAPPGVGPLGSGIIPAGGLSGRALDARTRTTYDAHINDAGSRAMRVADLRELSNAQNALAVARLLGGATGEERAALMKLHREMQSRRLPASIPMPVERRILKERVGGHARSLQTRPAWLSTWTGPGAA